MNTSVDQVADQPLVAAAIGPDTSGEWHRLAASLGVDTLLDTPGVRFAASRAPGLEPVTGGWCWGRHIQRARRPTGPRDAAHELDLAGLWWDGNHGVLHTGLLGVQDLYTRTIGDTTYVANRVAPLASIGPPLDVDWEAWALFLSVNHFSDEDTGFTQVRRLTLGGLLEFTGTTAPVAAADIPAWLLQPEGTGSMHDLWGAIRSSVRPRLREEVDLTLSGGLDSRLILAALNRRRSVRISAWTTQGSASAGDVEMATALAIGRTRSHIRVESSLEDWVQNFLPTVRQLEHGTSAHTWLQPLSRAVRHRTATLYDGFGGDLILRRQPRTRPSVVENGWYLATGGRWERDDRFLSPTFRDQYGEALRAKWEARGDRWSGHPSEQVLRHFTTRTNRGIALSPFRLFATARRVITPLTDPQVFAVAMSLAPATTDAIDYRDILLERYAPAHHALPATGRAGGPAYPFQDHASAPTSLAHLIEIINREPAAAEPLDPGLRELMAARNYPMMKWQARLLASSAVLSDWLATWRPRLTGTDQPWT